jgi:hypothetical protein
MHNARVQLLARRKSDRLRKRIHRQPNSTRLPLTGEIIATSAFTNEQCLCHEAPGEFSSSSAAQRQHFGRSCSTGVATQSDSERVFRGWRKLAKRLALESNGSTGCEPDRRQRGGADRRTVGVAPISEAVQDGAEKPTSLRRFPQRTGQRAGASRLIAHDSCRITAGTRFACPSDK